MVGGHDRIVSLITAVAEAVVHYEDGAGFTGLHERVRRQRRIVCSVRGLLEIDGAKLLEENSCVVLVLGADVAAPVEPAVVYTYTRVLHIFECIGSHGDIAAATNIDAHLECVFVCVRAYD